MRQNFAKSATPHLRQIWRVTKSVTMQIAKSGLVNRVFIKIQSSTVCWSYDLGLKTSVNVADTSSFLGADKHFLELLIGSDDGGDKRFKNYL